MGQYKVNLQFIFHSQIETFTRLEARYHHGIKSIDETHVFKRMRAAQLRNVVKSGDRKAFDLIMSDWHWYNKIPVTERDGFWVTAVEMWG